MFPIIAQSLAWSATISWLQLLRQHSRLNNSPEARNVWLTMASVSLHRHNPIQFTNAFNISASVCPTRDARQSSLAAIESSRVTSDKINDFLELLTSVLKVTVFLNVVKYVMVNQ